MAKYNKPQARGPDPPSNQHPETNCERGGDPTRATQHGRNRETKNTENQARNGSKHEAAKETRGGQTEKTVAPRPRTQADGREGAHRPEQKTRAESRNSDRPSETKKRRKQANGHPRRQDPQQQRKGHAPPRDEETRKRERQATTAAGKPSERGGERKTRHPGGRHGTRPTRNRPTTGSQPAETRRREPQKRQGKQGKRKGQSGRGASLIS